MYNLLEGYSYYFEEDSAIVVGFLLQHNRNIGISMLSLSKELDIHIDCILEFAEQLCNLGLLTKKAILQEEIDSIRKAIVKRQNQTNAASISIQANPDDFILSGAEEEYSQSVNGWSNVVIELTYRCNEQCIHCYNIGSAHYPTDKNTRGDRKELSFLEYKKVIDELCEQGMFKVCLTGGDPFVNNSAWKVIEYLYEKEVAIDIYTNGQALIGHCERLASFFPRVVGISIYSADPTIHDEVTRVKGSFQKSIQVVETLSELGVHIQLKCCVLNTNFDSYKSIYDLAEKYNVLPQMEINIRNTLDGNRFASEVLRLEDAQYEELFADKNIIPYIDGNSIDKVIPRDFSSNACKAGINGCTLTPEGDIIPCPSFHLVLGNVREKHINEIYNDEKIRWWKSITLKDYKECGGHKYCDFCSICPGENYSDTLSPLKASPNKCFMAKKRHSYALKLYRHKKGED